MWKLNTSNRGKYEEFKRLFAQLGCDLETSHIDLEEINADPLLVIAHKASQLAEYVIVDDTSLNIEEASVGVNIRWLLDHLSEYNGRKAEWVVMLAYRQEDEIRIYKGIQTGTIVLPKGNSSFGFDPVFLPDGATETLAESKPDVFSARAKAVQALVEGNYTTHPIIKEWDGPWQRNSY